MVDKRKNQEEEMETLKERKTYTFQVIPLRCRALFRISFMKQNMFLGRFFKTQNIIIVPKEICLTKDFQYLNTRREL